MKQHFSEGVHALLARHGLDSFEALWGLELTAVDEPNTGRGGWSSVSRLDLEGQGFYLKRQRNYLTRSLRHPLGEPTFAREFRNIHRYSEMHIPALQAAYFGQRRQAGEVQAILLTRALDGWDDLEAWLERWPSLSALQQAAILRRCGELARTVHAAGQVHGCFYPKHIFLRPQGDAFDTCLIDLEKTRPAWFGQRDRTRDLEPLVRRASAWHEADIRNLLASYLGEAPHSPNVETWLGRLSTRRRHKEAR